MNLQDFSRDAFHTETCVWQKVGVMGVVDGQASLKLSVVRTIS